MRTRPQLITTISPDMYALLIREKARDNRPMSYVVDQALRTWAGWLAYAGEVEALRRARDVS